MNLQIVVVLLASLLAFLGELEGAAVLIGSTADMRREKRWTSDNDAVLRDLLRSGLALEAIAAKLERAAADVGRRIRELGLEV